MTDSTDDTSRACLLNTKPDNKQEQDSCPWHINSPKHHNCFWLYVKDMSNIDGSMPELVQSEIAHLLGWSNTKTHFMLKQAMVELVDALKLHNAKDLIVKTDDPSIDILSFDIQPVPSKDSDE